MGTYFRRLRALKNLRQLDLQLKTVWTPAVGKSKRRSYDNLHTPQPLIAKSDCWHRRLGPSGVSQASGRPSPAVQMRDAGHGRRTMTRSREGKRSAHNVITEATLVSQAVRNSRKR